MPQKWRWSRGAWVLGVNYYGAMAFLLLVSACMLLGVPVCVWLVSRTTGDLLTGRLQSATKTDFEQAMNQIEAMRGSGSGSHGVWDGVDRLGSAGMDRLGGTL